MRVITGFIPASRGRVEIGGHDIAANPIAAKSRMGYLPENAPLYQHMTVTGFLNFIAGIRGFSGAARRRQVAEAIEKCFLGPVRHQAIETLSKGYRHRACFAQAILHDPDILILDEPTDGLDPNQKREIRNLIRDMGRGKAIIISTHILEEVEAVASRVALIANGGKIFDGTPHELKSRAPNAGSVTIIYAGELDPGVVNTLRTCPDTDSVAILDQGRRHFTLSARPAKHRPPAQAHAAILALASSQPRELLEFRVEEGRLDEVFHQMTMPGNAEVKS
jgi:ABC-2 type transport system ATP-binding protein